MIIVVVTFVVILALVLGAYWLFVLRVDQSEEAALRKRLQPDPRRPSDSEEVPAAEAGRAVEQRAPAQQRRWARWAASRRRCSATSPRPA